MSFTPFSDVDSHSAFRHHLKNTLREIDALENDYVLRCSVTELEDHFTEKARIDPLILHADQRYIRDQQGIEIDVSHDFRLPVFPGERAVVPGTRLTIALPYEGDPDLWKIGPSTFGISGYPDIEVRDNHILLSFSFPDDSADAGRLKKQVDQDVDFLVENVQNLREDVDRHNQQIVPQIKQRIALKRDKALGATNAVAALGIPIKQQGQAPTYTIPAKRRTPPVKLPEPTTTAFSPEPVLAEEEYEHILSVLRGMSLVIERNPDSFATLDEESIRDHFLIQLNGHYQGGATGETFNRSGKTDILIRERDRNVFIAECKFWRGVKAFDEAIEQLLGYLSWRDCKCALLVFNKTKDSSAVAAKMHEAMEARAEHRRTVSRDLAGDSRYVYVKDSDPGRDIIITTQLFDVPTS